MRIIFDPSRINLSEITSNSENFTNETQTQTQTQTHTHTHTGTLANAASLAQKDIIQQGHAPRKPGLCLFVFFF